ncbi:MAG: prolipoprotein diacylglyceryl transferase [Clostridiales bacterium]|nr:prolipoprotein diacylglyceryl transferase [Clostridiales bacterium]
MPDVWFPHLGIKIAHLSRTAFTIFGLEIAWYGLIIALGVAAGLGLACLIAKKTGQKSETYTDFIIYALIFSILGARIYYVIFSWDYYADNLMQIFNLRGGGLAIYGGVIGAVATALIYCKIKKYDTWLLIDTAIPGLALGQAIGRWGNFCNQEVFGGYTDGLFAMRLNVETAAYTTPELMEKAITEGGVTYIQVQPTFLYESAGNLLLVILMLLLWKKRKTPGVIFCTYLIGYGLLRFVIEYIRTDQLMLWGTNIPVSMALSAVLVVGGIILYIVLRKRNKA